MPSPRRRIVSRVCCSAWASRSARRAASAASAISGATTSRIRRPIRPSSLGPNSPARSTRWASANATVVASTPAGSAVSARSITRACASDAVPSRIAAASTGRCRSSAVGQTQVRARVGVRRPGVLRQPARGVPRGGVSGEVAGVGEDPQPQLRHLGLRSHQLPQRGRLLRGRHERRVRVGDRLEHRPDVAGGSNDRVRHPGPLRRRRSTARTRGISSVVAPGGPEHRAITHPRNSPSEPGLSALVTESWWPGSVGERDSILRCRQGYSQACSMACEGAISELKRPLRQA